MALTAQQVERKLEQHGNDIVSIYEMLTGITVKQGEHDELLAQILAILAEHDARFDSHDARFDAHDARFDSLDAQLAEILRRLPEPPAA